MNIYQRDHTKVPPLFTLIKEHDTQGAIAHLQRHPEEVHLRGWMSDTPLHQAAYHNELEVAKFLLEMGADVNARRTGVYEMPLSWAGSREMVQLLRAHGAIFNGEELGFATRSDKADVIDELLKQGAPVQKGMPPFANCHSVEALQAYLQNGLDVNALDAHGRNILHHMAWAEKPDLFDLAVRHGAKWLYDNQGYSPFHVVTESRSEQEIFTHLKIRYAKGCLPKLVPIGRKQLQDSYGIRFFRAHPNRPGEFYALFHRNALVRLKLERGRLYTLNMVQLVAPTIHNFTFSPLGDLVLPTYSGFVQVVDPESLVPKTTLDIQHLYLSQITYSSLHSCYFGSDGWHVHVFDSDFNHLGSQNAHDHIYYPILSSDGKWMATRCSDQEIYHNLYQIQDNRELEYKETFFIEWENSSDGFAFAPDSAAIAVSYPQLLEGYALKQGKWQKQWTQQLAPQGPKDVKSQLAFVNDDLLLEGRGKVLFLRRAKDGEVITTQQLGMDSDIQWMHIDRESNSLFLFSAHNWVVLRGSELWEGKA